MEATLDSSRLDRKDIGNNRVVSIDTVSLTDLLKEHSAPKVIDFLSIDTEGSELDILSAFDFSEYNFNAIAVEHNYGSQREDIQKLLAHAGYRRVFDFVSRWDDWYIPEK
jgi:predicted protein tyrosine phosphatase